MQQDSGESSLHLPGLVRDGHCVVPIFPGVATNAVVLDCPSVDKPVITLDVPSVDMLGAAHACPHTDTAKYTDLNKWLNERLRAERAALIRQIDAQHTGLLDDFQRQLSTSSRPFIKANSSLSGQALQRLVKMSRDGTDAMTATPSGISAEGVFQKKVSKMLSQPFSQMTEPWGSLSLMLRSFAAPVDNSKAAANRIEEFVKSQTFELMFACVILFNATVMAVKLQYDGLNAGYNLGFRTYDVSAANSWPGISSVLDSVDNVFTCIFTLELLVRMAAYRIRWFCSLWNYLDAVVVGIALASWSLPDLMSLNPTFVRLVRFGKLMRIVRVMRSNKLLESLKLLVASIHASFNTLCCSLGVLLLIQSVAGMLLSQLVEPYINNEANPLDVRREVFAHYGTFWRSMITMFEITFANWAPTCRLLLDNVSEGFGSFFLIYRCVVGFAMLSVIQAVFIQQTMKSAQLDDDFMIQQKTREKEAYAEKLKRVFNTLDTSGDGHVSWEEFEILLKQEHMQLLMSTLEVDVRDLETLFKLLDDGDGRISPEEFVNGLQRMKGSAKALDLVTLMRITRRIEAKLDYVTPNSPNVARNRHTMDLT